MDLPVFPGWSLALATAPTVEPVSVAEVQTSLRVDSDADEDLVTALAIAARQWCEAATSRAFVTQTWRLALDAWPAGGSFLIPRPPLLSVSGVSYVDALGDTQVWASDNYIVSGDLEPARLSLAPGASWPTVADRPDAVTVTYTAGYGGPAQVPQPLRAAILLKCQALYDRDPKEAEMLEQAARSLLGPYRVHYF